MIIPECSKFAICLYNPVIGYYWVTYEYERKKENKNSKSKEV